MPSVLAIATSMIAKAKGKPAAAATRRRCNASRLAVACSLGHLPGGQLRLEELGGGGVGIDDEDAGANERVVPVVFRLRTALL